MIYLGFLLAAVGVGVAVYGYCETLKKRDREYADTLSLLVYLKGAVLCERRTPREAITRFMKSGGVDIPGGSVLSDEAFCDRESCGLTASCSPSLLFEKDRELLSDFLSKLGRGTLDEERARIGGVIDKMEKSAEAIRVESEKKQKSLWVLYATAALGALLVII